ncbi:D-aminoacyl-tRNA deacylase [Bacillus spizizenii]|uniref:D-aminoacyl-tRNA deacylase n=1 Tax=Bacillus spizizenii (strain DSM 15029 / JCM 12233 / NBRC 101239 / NRRL B-23049 / TU-B-10) TaxID=1052585 RepID=G4NY94_BACS4|nr:D-aminoacyl-tRNA deacylase [Bacillus spizizenii]AEP87603.1 D-tyrosyl-tRNA(Tyr) deacylase [Bacillus spizizenii TU-B-10]KXJ38400.1 D-tyrosyl-tRNA(Tyr) deacylase [Bacillus spizizenii]MCI4168366.1 D-aminoacyl-tRNA deacylase [Bacillus spizizenii]MEC1436835.1 D-aminoacyl-tRNA deacylase [Bacillus spizizenii]MED0869269.1 D-aminoacyl-tRNA deacylase [Bacillus spizizenii]
MRLVVQRVTKASVTVDEEVVGQIGQGLMVLVGITHDDTEEDAAYLADKVVHLRIFDDSEGKMNLSLLDIGGEILSVSQFTLYGDTRKGRRPNYMNAAKPDKALGLYEKWNDLLREKGIKVETGTFGAMMDVQLTNSGPVTLIMDSK